MKKIMKGVVVSNKMTKALVVAVDSLRMNEKYKKTFKLRNKFSVSCKDSSLYNPGSSVEIIECPPISKTIRFKVIDN